MEFQIEGLYRRKRRALKWIDGRLEGDELLACAVRSRARAYEKAGIPYGLPSGPKAAAASGILSNHQIAVMLISEVLDKVISSTWQNPNPIVDDGESVQ